MLWWDVGIIIHTILGSFFIMLNLLQGYAEENFRRLGASVLAWVLWAIVIVIAVVVRK